MEVDDPTPESTAAAAAAAAAQQQEPHFEIVHGFKFLSDPSAPVASTSTSASPTKETPAAAKSTATSGSRPTATASTTTAEKTVNKTKKPSKPKGASSSSSSKPKTKVQKPAEAAKTDNKTASQADPSGVAAAKSKKKPTNKSTKPTKTGGDGSKKPPKKKAKTSATHAGDPPTRSISESVPDDEALHHHHHQQRNLVESIPAGYAYDPDADTDEEDDREWCVCKMKYAPGMLMICCDICDDWYHPTCLSMDEDDVALVNSFYCPKCTAATGKRTTWFARCSRHDCNNAQQALSKFCSDYCGIEVAATKLKKLRRDPLELWDLVKNAQKRQGYVLHHDPYAPEQTEDHFKLPLFSSATPPSVQTRTKMALESSPSKVQLRTALPAFDNDKEELSAERKTQSIKSAIEDNIQQQSALQHTTDLLEARYKLYRIAFKNWESATLQGSTRGANSSAKKAEAATNGGGEEPEEDAEGSKGKKGKGGANNNRGKSMTTTANEAPCGLDERLTWQDDEWKAWVESAAGQMKLQQGEDADADTAAQVRESERGLVCTIPRKRCDRHQGWQKLHDSALDLNMALQKRKAEKLQQLKIDLERQLSEHMELQGTLRSQRSTVGPGGVPLPPVTILNGVPV